ncbi:hypothetical protein [Nostoc sp. PA-18-2419]|uniref:hypothetical protein n=1 Tax=Nostoc sp. PA-18-2419 TaxID=2575443 RepID=UPI00110829B7|nr:hypothetical protein [Nostoc sp. PA-18-2419]
MTFRANFSREVPKPSSSQGVGCREEQESLTTPHTPHPTPHTLAQKSTYREKLAFKAIAANHCW